MKKQSGFTLIELMIVVAIVAILAAIALPAYQTYTKKGKFSEVMVATSAMKTALEVCASSNNLANCTEGNNGVPTITGYPKGYVNSLSIGTPTSTAVTITAAGSTDVDSKTYELVGAVDNGRIVWTSSGSCKTVGYCN